MRRLSVLVANAVLLALCCFLVASVFNEFSTGLLTTARSPGPSPPETDTPPARSWEDREPILERNLFGSVVGAEPVAPAPEPEEDLEETRLPLRLLGTAVAENPVASRAAIEAEGAGGYEVVRVGDFLRSHEQVQVASIERRRVILVNGNRREELRLDEDAEEPVALAAMRNPRRSRPSPSPDLAALAARSTARPDLEQAAPSPEEELAAELKDLAIDDGGIRSGPALLDQGRFSPQFSEGHDRILGVQIHDIEPGGFYDKLGFKEGDVITGVNGIEIQTIEAANEMLLEFNKAEEFDIELANSAQPIKLTPEQLGKLLNQ